MATGAAIIKRALLRIGVVEAGEEPNDVDMSDGLASLNELMGSWSVEGLLTPGLDEVEYTVEAEKSILTLGPAGSSPEPDIEVEEQFMSIDRLMYQPEGTTFWSALNEESIEAIGERASSQNPRYFFHNRTHPIAELVFNAPLAVGDEITITGRRTIHTLTLNDDIEMPEGYERAILLNLAMDLAPTYGKPSAGETARFQLLDRQARMAKANLQMLNLGRMTARRDPGLWRSYGNNRYIRSSSGRWW